MFPIEAAHSAHGVGWKKIGEGRKVEGTKLGVCAVLSTGEQVGMKVKYVPSWVEHVEIFRFNGNRRYATQQAFLKHGAARHPRRGIQCPIGGPDGSDDTT